ncbi:hypothetical protein NN561_010371 [Cricetulus griseus]
MNPLAQEGCLASQDVARGSVAGGRGLAVLRRRSHPPSTCRGFPSVHHHHPSSPRNFLPASKSGHFISKSRSVLFPPSLRPCVPPAAAGAGPGPVSACGHAQRSLPNPGADGRRRRRAGRAGGPGTRPLRHLARQIRQPRNGPSRVPAPRSGRRREPAALPPPAARAAAPPPCRAGGSWLPRGPSEARLHGGLRAGPHPGTGVQTPGRSADAGTRTRRKPAELEDVPGRPRRARPTHRTGARSRARSRQGLWGALRDAGTAGGPARCEDCQVSPLPEETALSHLH